jgi:nucleotide-binding universal stress UspA family protein
MSYKRILVAIDGSDTSMAALQEAIQLAKSLQANLTVINIVDVAAIYMLNIAIDYDNYRKLVNEEGEAILEKAKQLADNQHIQITTQLIEILDIPSKISEKMIETTKALKSDLLVLGTHGRRGFNRLLLGSVAEETIRLADIPVLLVHAKK